MNRSSCHNIVYFFAHSCIYHDSLLVLEHLEVSELLLIQLWVVELPHNLLRLDTFLLDFIHFVRLDDVIFEIMRLSVHFRADWAHKLLVFLNMPDGLPLLLYMYLEVMLLQGVLSRKELVAFLTLMVHMFRLWLLLLLIFDIRTLIFRIFFLQLLINFSIF